MSSEYELPSWRCFLRHPLKGIETIFWFAFAKLMLEKIKSVEGIENE